MKGFAFAIILCAFSLLFIGGVAGFLYGQTETRKLDLAEQETAIQMTTAKGIEDCQEAVSETIQACGDACIETCQELCPNKTHRPEDL